MGKYNLTELKELCHERGLTLRRRAKKALRAFEEAHRISVSSQNENKEEEEVLIEEEKNGLTAGLGLGEGPDGIRSAAASEV